MAAALTGSPLMVSLGEGYAVRSPGIQGVAELRRPRSAAERSRSRAEEDGTAALDLALEATNVTEVRQIDLRLQQTPPAAGAARSLRSGDGQELLELSVPDLGPQHGQLVLACDETGVLTWHHPEPDPSLPTGAAARGGGPVKRFLIPATRPTPAPPAVAAQRSLIGVVGRKLLKVLVYPLLDPVVGKISELFAESWETRYRPYRLRNFAPGTFREPDSSGLGAGDWDRLTSGRALLFIHGTFSTAHGAFSQIADTTLGTLHARYGGRTLAFDHFTLSHDPRRNVEWLLSNLPPGGTLDADVVCHSRGGLVARTLAERPSPFGLDTSRIAIRRIVFVGVPNQGTLLADPDHMVKMIDRITSALNLFPAGPVVETLEALITAVKVIGHGALRGLDGLSAMLPQGDFLRTLNQGAPAGVSYSAVAADFEPTDQGLRALISGSVVDGVADRVFQETPNDLVVPEPGVYAANGSAAFPIGEAHLLRVPAAAGVVHTTLFAHAETNAKLLEWLQG